MVNAAAKPSAPIILREISWPAVIITGLGGFILLMIAILSVLPKQNPPPVPWAPYAIGLGSLAMLLGGIWGLKKGKIALILESDCLSIPQFKISIPWKLVKSAKVFKVERADQGMPHPPVLGIRVEKEARPLIGDSPVSNAPYAVDIEPTPHICLKMALVDYGPDMETAFDLAKEIKRRIAVAKGQTASLEGGVETAAAAKVPDGLMPREMSDTGPWRRAYRHDDCKSLSVVSGGSFAWVVNPFRYGGGETMCARCGKAVPDSTLRWADTGETISKFRRRMWKNTPKRVKMINLFILPFMVSIAVQFVVGVANFGKPPIPPDRAFALAGGSFIVGILLIILTPLAGVIPYLFGLRYNRYL